MMVDIPSNYHAFQLKLVVSSVQPIHLNIEVFDPNKPYTYYIKRSAPVNGKRVFYLRFPVSPQWLKAAVFNGENGNLSIGEDSSFAIEEIKVEKLTVYDVWWNKETKSFYNFAVQFAENASIIKAGKGKRPAIYRSEDSKFTIDYYDVIRDKTSGNVLTTPARIGHNSGIIEVSKHSFLQYTVPMRLVILLHEFAHKYLNPKIGKEIDYETGADIQALYIYLGKGWSESEAHFAFLNVFKNANNDPNHVRYKIIKDFISKYSRGLIERKL